VAPSAPAFPAVGFLEPGDTLFSNIAAVPSFGPGLSSAVFFCSAVFGGGTCGGCLLSGVEGFGAAALSVPADGSAFFCLSVVAGGLGLSSALPFFSGGTVS
jgi:hypothetical protein